MVYLKYFLLFFLIFFLIFMSDPNWGMLSKSQSDDETIEEAIARIVAEHNADEESHLDTGQSLQSHKASEIIDHLALSIVEDKIGDGEISLEKLTADHRIIISSFESLDGWNTGGTLILELGSLTLKTGNTTNDYAYVYDVPSGQIGLTWDKDFFWQSTIKLAQITNQLIYFGIGGSEYVGGYSGAGFKISNGTLYCYHMDIVATVYTYVTFEITGIDLTIPHVYRIKYNQSEGTLSFYIDGVLKKTFDSGLPEDDSDELALYQVKTLEDAYKYLYAFDLLISIPK